MTRGAPRCMRAPLPHATCRQLASTVAHASPQRLGLCWAGEQHPACTHSRVYTRQHPTNTDSSSLQHDQHAATSTPHAVDNKMETMGEPVMCQVSNKLAYYHERAVTYAKSVAHLGLGCEWRCLAVWSVLRQRLEPLSTQRLHQAMHSRLVACRHAAGCVPYEALPLQQQLLTLAIIILQCELPGLRGVGLQLALQVGGKHGQQDKARHVRRGSGPQRQSLSGATVSIAVHWQAQ